jgi:hypothetical protein
VLEGFKHTSTKIPSPQNKQNQNFKTSSFELGLRAKLKAGKTIGLRIKPVRTRYEDFAFGEYRRWRSRRRKRSRGLDDAVLLVEDIGVSWALKRDLHGSAHATLWNAFSMKIWGMGGFRIFLGNGREKVTVHFKLVPSPALLLLGLGRAGPNLISLITFLF